jgi:hypothetical protein
LIENKDRIIARIYSVPSCLDEKTFSLTFGSDMVVIGRMHGWPNIDSRTPVDFDDDNEISGPLELLLEMSKEGRFAGTTLLFGCIVFKNHLLGSNNRHLDSIQEATRTNWETFE